MQSGVLNTKENTHSICDARTTRTKKVVKPALSSHTREAQEVAA